MKKDIELEKIRGICNRLDELERFFYSGGMTEKQIRRILKYIASRYGYLFDYVLED